MILVYCAIVALSYYLGYIVNLNLKKKKEYFKSALQFLERFKQNVSFTQKSLSEFIKGFNSFSKEFSETLNSFCVLRFNEEQHIKVPQFLTNEEKQSIKNMLCLIGFQNEYTEMEHLENSKFVIEEYYTLSKNKYEKYGSLFIKLGLLLGFLIVILLL